MKIELKNISHFYDTKVLNNISLSLSKYKSIAIIGVSGSGKSTLIRLMSGLELPTTGSIYINGFAVENKEYKNKIGFVFQNHNLFPHLTLKKNIALILEKTRGYTKDEAANVANENLNLLHLGDQANKLPKNVSGGQAQRASIARALSMKPDIIFLDEPTSSLDPILTHEVLTEIENLKKLGKDFIIVTHVMSFAKDFADYILFMHEGEIVEQGETTILDNPLTQELKDFMSKVR